MHCGGSFTRASENVDINAYDSALTFPTKPSLGNYQAAKYSLDVLGYG
jgi:hypothetical protein